MRVTKFRLPGVQLCDCSELSPVACSCVLVPRATVPQEARFLEEQARRKAAAEAKEHERKAQCVDSGFVLLLLLSCC